MRGGGYGRTDRRTARRLSPKTDGTGVVDHESYWGRSIDRLMDLPKIFALGALMMTAAVVGWAEEARFSQRLTPAERAEVGLVKLSSDQLAVLDALVRRDEKMNAMPDATHPPPARFTQRLSSEERKSAGLNLLSEAELARLDVLIDQVNSGHLLSPKPKPATSALKPEPTSPSPEIHGMLSFTYGMGRGGYREEGGAVALSLDGPAHDFSLFVGYEEMRGKGPLLDRGYAGSYFLARPLHAVPSVVH